MNFFCSIPESAIFSHYALKLVEENFNFNNSLINICYNFEKGRFLIYSKLFLRSMFSAFVPNNFHVIQKRQLSRHIRLRSDISQHYVIAIVACRVVVNFDYCSYSGIIWLAY